MRAVLVALAAAIAIVAGSVAALGGSEDALPAWVPATLEGIALRPGDEGAFPVTRELALGTVRRAAFLDDAPHRKPISLPVLAAGRIARAPLPVSPSGEVDIPKAEDAPAWLVVWRGVDGAELERFGTWPDGALVDAVFLVDAVTGDCCWLNLFLSGDSRLG